jgi:hypothetical protein
MAVKTNIAEGRSRLLNGRGDWGLRFAAQQGLAQKGLAIAIALLGAATCASSGQTTQPAASTSPSTEHLSAKVTAVNGRVQYRESADKPWKVCAVGVELAEGAEFRTGPRSNVQLLIPPKQTITLDRLGSMTLLEAVQTAGKYKTDVGLKHGRVRYDIEAPGVEHESTVSSPNGTLAVRDTSFAVDDERPFDCEAYRLSGTVDFSTAKRTISIGGGVPGAVKAVGDQDPANTSLSAAVLDPADPLSREPSEEELVATVLGRGPVFTPAMHKGIAIVSGGTPPTDAALPALLPGDLDFVLRWNGNANLDLGVIDLARAETLYPATGLNVSPSGGIIPYNDIGGTNGGIELAYWKRTFPKGLYEFIINGVSGVPVDYNVEVFEHGSLDTIYTATTGVTAGFTALTGPISKGRVVSGIVEVGGGSPIPPTSSPPTSPPISPPPTNSVVHSLPSHSSVNTYGHR